MNPALNIRAALNTLGTHSYSLPLVILYVTAGCNLRCLTCSYRDPLPNELSIDEIRHLAQELSQRGLRHIVFSGGEPLMRRDFPAIFEIFGSINVKRSLLTNGLLLEKRYDASFSSMHEIIVSLDGSNPDIHNRIRGVESFDQIVRGIRKVITSSPRPEISIRTVVQRANFRDLGNMVSLARSLHVDRVSFLAADVLSRAFHRDHQGPVGDDDTILLSSEECREFRSIVQVMIRDHSADFQSTFISEPPAKMMHIVEYFEAFHGLSPFPRNSCNAPMTSAVITSTGELLPCYFLPAFGDIRSGSVGDQLNNEQIRFTRAQVRKYTLEQCQRCVCTLKVSPWAALLNRF